MKVNKNLDAKYIVVGRYMYGVSVVGYVIKDRAGVPRRVSKEVFEELALQGQVYNCSANIYNNSVNLRGIGIKLKDLPTKNLRGTM